MPLLRFSVAAYVMLNNHAFMPVICYSAFAVGFAALEGLFVHRAGLAAFWAAVCVNHIFPFSLLKILCLVECVVPSALR